MSEATETVDMDALFEQGLDAEQTAKAEADMLIPVGSYRTTPPMMVSVKQFDAKGDEGSDDFLPARTVCNAYGAISNVKAVKSAVQEYEAGERQGRIGFRFSAQPVVKNGDYDRTYKNYVALFRAYTVAYGVKPTSLNDLKTYLETYPVDLRVIQIGTQEDATGEPANLVVGITAVKA